MIPQNWQTELKNSTLDLAKLLTILNLKPEQFSKPLSNNPTFKIRATQSYLNKINPANPNDPLLLQILPFVDEQLLDSDYSFDPVGDLLASPASGLIKKYHGRALLLATSICPVHCRYCFRRSFPYQTHLHLNQAITTLEQDKTINEVILSGGDPLSLSNAKLADLLAKLSAIKHLKILRIHSRFPSVLPSRLDAELLDILSASRFKIVLVSHINHPNEIDNITISALKPFKEKITLLNQSVLLKQINDTKSVQINLSKRLFEAGILPYYLHLLDKVHGTKAFEIPIKQAIILHQQMQAELPGYLVPRLVSEQQGKPNKTLIMVDK